MTPPRYTDERAHQPKGMLFCPECSHEADATDDWLEMSAGNLRYLVCPECGTTIDKRVSRPPHPPAEAD